MGWGLYGCRKSSETYFQVKEKGVWCPQTTVHFPAADFTHLERGLVGDTRLSALLSIGGTRGDDTLVRDGGSGYSPREFKRMFSGTKF